jgi:hypothetical protein
LTNYSKYSDSFSPEEQDASWFSAGYNAALNVTGFGAGLAGLSKFGSALETVSISSDALDAGWGQQAYSLINKQRKDEAAKQQTKVPLASSGSAGSRPQATTLPSQQPAFNSQVTSQGQASGGGYASFISSLQNFVASLSAYVSSLSGSNN